MKHFLRRAGLLVIVIALLGVWQVTKAQDNWPISKGKRICHILELGHPYSTAVVGLAKKEVALFGFQYDVFDTQGDIPTEIRLIEDCVTKKYDAIILVVYDPTALNQALKKAYDAKIPVIAEGGFPDAEGEKYIVTEIGTDGTNEGKAAGALICSTLKAGQNWVMIEGAPGHPLVPLRGMAKDITAKNCPDVKMLAADTGQWNREKARTVMENFLTAYPNKIDLVYCHNDDMCLGAAKAIAEAGLKDKIKVVGIDGGSKETYDAIRDGTMYASILNDASFIAVNMIHVARDAFESRPFLSQYISPSLPVTKENVDKFPALF